MLKEKKGHGYISDGSGRRYRAGVLYVLCGDIEKALEFYAWYDEEFPDDSGEPISHLYRSLALYRAGKMPEARLHLQGAMLQNVYMLPLLFGEPMERLAIWHPSNRERPEYLADVAEYLEGPTPEERAWMKAEFHSDRFRRLRDGYIDTYRALLGEREIERRRRILNEWYRFSEAFFREEG